MTYNVHILNNLSYLHDKSVERADSRLLHLKYKVLVITYQLNFYSLFKYVIIVSDFYRYSPFLPLYESFLFIGLLNN